MEASLQKLTSPHSQVRMQGLKELAERRPSPEVLEAVLRLAANEKDPEVASWLFIVIDFHQVSAEVSAAHRLSLRRLLSAAKNLRPGLSPL